MIKTEPPAAGALAPLDRRALIKGGLFGAGLVAAPLSAQLGGSGFTHGVASGEPGQERVLLWTRFVAPQDVRLGWQVMEADANRRVVAEGNVTASSESDGCCKVVAEGLQPDRWYYYRFTARDGSVSDEGRTKTLPAGRTDKFRMAVFSCSNIAFGWFNAYAAAAQADDFDCVLHLGDYFYEYSSGQYPSPEQAVAGRSLAPDHEIISLTDYRLRYATYRSDPDLRRLHQLFPMISGWDDHESANDSWEGGAQNHQSDIEGQWNVRKATAMRAYREWMPVSDDPWAAYEVGDLATLFRLETRLTARAEQFSLSDVIRGKADADQTMAALAAFGQGEYLDSSREMLGLQQQGWLADGLKRSKASGKTWQVLVQQVLMGQLFTAPRLAENLPGNIPDFVRQRILAGAMASRAEVPLSMDAWSGYPAARARVYEAALAADANLVSLAGDTHNSWAFELGHESTPVGVEFGGPSVTSPGLESYATHLASGDLERATVDYNRELSWMDASRRGYMAVELTPERATSEYRFVGSVRDKGAGIVASQRVSTVAGSHRLAVG